MSNRSLVELNHDYCISPSDTGALVNWARAMMEFMRAADPNELPAGVVFKALRHHTDPDTSAVFAMAPWHDKCFEAKLPGEPYLQLLARDPNAPGRVRGWARTREIAIERGRKPTEDAEFVADARAIADAMDAWRAIRVGAWEGIADPLPDEPRFTLLGRDTSGPAIVRNWSYERARAIYHGAKPETDRAKVEAARRIADVMVLWRRENDGAWRVDAALPAT